TIWTTNHMKAQPLAFKDSKMVPVEPKDATHLRILVPGPSKSITIPVQLTDGNYKETGNWVWNGDVMNPTLRPSLLTECGHYAKTKNPHNQCWCTYNRDHPNDNPVFTCYRCHSWVTDGKVQFLGDSTHELAGQTVDLLDLQIENLA